MFSEFTFSNLIKAVRKPSLFYYELQKLLVDFNILYQNTFYDHTGVDPVNADWDNLIILDGCRYDMFEKIYFLEGELQRVTSPASESWEYLSKCFDGRDLHDTIYITANPHVDKLREGTFFAVVNLLGKAWDSQLQTVPPDEVVEETKRVHETYTDKRLIVHFMQPHFPFLGPEGKGIDHSGIRPSQGKGEPSKEVKNIWSQLRYGRANKNQVCRAYQENLELVLRHVKKLLIFLSGKTIVTSDHGNMIGERVQPLPVSAFGHPRGLRASKLNDVPWLEINSDHRRDVKAEPPLTPERLDSNIIESRLESLGYK